MVPNFNPKEVGARLILARESLGLSQRDVCNSLGISTSNWNRFEKGHRLIGTKYAQAFSDRYGFGLTFIFAGSERDLPDELRSKLAAHRRSNSA